MSRRAGPTLLFAGGLVVLAGALYGAEAAPPPPEPLRVLFIGNSYSNHNELTQMVERLSYADERGPRIETTLYFRAGCTLGRHWRRGRAVEMIRNGDYTHLVLQGHSLDAVDRPNGLAGAAERFDRVAEANGMEMVLFATWARRYDRPIYDASSPFRTPAQMQAVIDRVYYGIGAELHARVAPAGRAWRNAVARHPRPHLYGNDGSHPARAGSYLAACVLYGTLTGRMPRDIAYFAGLAPPLAYELQWVAEQTLVLAPSPSPGHRDGGAPELAGL